MSVTSPHFTREDTKTKLVLTISAIYRNFTEGGFESTATRMMSAKLLLQSLKMRIQMDMLISLVRVYLSSRMLRFPRICILETVNCRRDTVLEEDGVPYRIRIGVYSVKGSCPRPLDEGDVKTF